MKTYFGIVILLLTINNAFTQILNQDADGKSSIVWSGGTIGIDITESSIKSNYYSSTDKTKGFLFGVDLQGKNESGIGALFNSSEFTPNVEISGLVGYYFTTTNYKKLEDKRDSVDNAINAHEDTINALQDTVDIAWEFYFEDCKKSLNKIENKDIEDEVRKIQNSFDFSKGASEVIKLLKKDVKVTTSVKLKTHQLLTELSIKLTNNNKIKRYNETNKNLVELRKKKVKIETNNTISSSKHKLYARPGLSTTEFSYDNGNDSISFDSRFVDTLDVNPFLEVGYTGRFGNAILGLSLGYSTISTFSKLDDKKYKYTLTDTTLQSGNLESTKEITAYSGDYKFLNRFYVNADFLYLINLNEENKDYLGLGTYFRTNFNSNTDLLKDNTVLGFNLNFLNGKDGKFLGGVYVQTSDLFNQNEKPFDNSISFGITAKLAIKSISL